MSLEKINKIDKYLPLDWQRKQERCALARSEGRGVTTGLTEMTRVTRECRAVPTN